MLEVYLEKFCASETFEISKLCRLCMKEASEMVDIKSTSAGKCELNCSIANKIKCCFDIEMEDDENMPERICQECLGQLTVSFQFREKCRCVDSKLRTIAQQNLLISQAQSLYGAVQLEDVTGLEKSINVEDICSQLVTDDRSETGVILEFDNRLSLNQNHCVENKKQKESCQKTLLENDTDVLHVEDFEVDPAFGDETASSDNDNFLGKTVEMEIDITDSNKSNVNVVEGESSDNGKLNSKQTVGAISKENKSFKMPTPDVHVVESADRGKHLAFRCKVCDEVFNSRNLYRTHASIHTFTEGLSCKYCSKWFPMKSSLIRHERIHSGVKPYLCLLCARSFTQKEILRRHILTHSNNKPFKCSHCEKSYTQKEALKMHEKNNHFERDSLEINQYQCALCDKAFCHPSGLSRHLQTHTGKKYPCSHCLSVFTDASSQKRHVRKKHAGEPE